MIPRDKMMKILPKFLRIHFHFFFRSVTRPIFMVCCVSMFLCTFYGIPHSKQRRFVRLPEIFNTSRDAERVELRCCQCEFYMLISRDCGKIRGSSASCCHHWSTYIVKLIQNIWKKELEYGKILLLVFIAFTHGNSFRLPTLKFLENSKYISGLHFNQISPQFSSNFLLAHTKCDIHALSYHLQWLQECNEEKVESTSTQSHISHSKISIKLKLKSFRCSP